MILPREFYAREAPNVAKDLLGCFLVTELPEGKAIGKIVETEAYLGTDDLASHSYKGQTKRNLVMFGPPGHGYIYFTYGMHYCFNTITGPEGVGEGVLIRALEPIEGVELMKRRRKIEDANNLCNGPAKLTQALGITTDLNGADLTQGPIIILNKDREVEVITTKRIGISKSVDLPLRFYCPKERVYHREEEAKKKCPPKAFNHKPGNK